MPLVKAQCTNCGGALDVDDAKDAAICPFCNTPFIVEKAVNLYKTEIVANGATINVSQTALDADTMFENWLVTRTSKLAEDFNYFYATDPRNEFIKLSIILNNDLFNIGKDGVNRAIELANRFLSTPRFTKYKDKEINLLTRYRNQIEGVERQRRNNGIDSIIREKKRNIWWVVLVAVVFSAGIIIAFIVSNSRSNYGNNKREREYSFFIMDVERGYVEEVLWNYENGRLLVKLNENGNYQGAHSYFTYPTDSKEALEVFFDKYDVKYGSLTLSPTTKKVLIFAFVMVWVISIILITFIMNKIRLLSNSKE